ncbi:MAG: response regulator [Deltaproteobacteria bacterium]|nr:response regulator [Deltaproteobacteria bacterium]
MVKMALERANYEVIYAYNGKEGIEKATQEKPDLIILDIMMPEKDGFIACGELKKGSETSTIPIIILTSIESSSLFFPDMEAAADSPHADEYINKPVDPHFLLKRVERLLRKSVA